MEKEETEKEKEEVEEEDEEAEAFVRGLWHEPEMDLRYQSLPRYLRPNLRFP